MPESTNIKKEATVRDFLNVIFRRKYLILSIVLLTTVAVLYLSASQPRTYTSSSRILVKRGQTGDVFTGRRSYLTWAEEVSSQIEVILSESVFAKAKEIFADSVATGRYPAALRFNPGSARAEVIGKSNVFSIGYAGYDPDECQLGCTAMTEAYGEYYRERSAPPAVSEYFKKEIGEALVDLESARGKKSEFLNTEKYVGLTEEAKRQSDKLSHLEIGLADLDTDLSSQKLRVDMYERLCKLPVEQLEANLAVGGYRNNLQTALMVEIKSGLQRFRLDREELLHRYTERHPEVVAVEKQIQDLLRSLKREVENASAVQKGEYRNLLARRETITGQLNVTRTALSVLPDKELQLSRIENAIASSQTRYDLLVRRQNEAEIAVVSTPEWQVTVLAAASKASPNKTRDYVRMALGPFLALVVGLGVAFFFESLDHTLKNVGEVEEYLGAPVLATFTEIRRKAKT